MSGDRIRREYRFTVLPEHLIRDKSITDRAVRLWCLLDRYAGSNGEAFPTRHRLADDLGCSRASVDRALAELVTAGWLRKERREAGGSNDYTLLEAKAPKTPRRKTKPQVSDRGALTSDDTPLDSPVSAGGGLTGDDTLDSQVTQPVITGDAHKEASLSEHQLSESADTSLRSVSGQPGESTPPLVAVEDKPKPADGASTTRAIGEPQADDQAGGKGKRRRATQLPGDFTITEGMRAWAANELPHLDVDAETEQFADHHRARGSTMKDWTAAWRTWMRNTRRFDRRQPRNAPANRHGTDANANELFGANHAWQ